HINLANLQFDPRVIKLLPQEMMQTHKVLPVAFSNNRLTLAMVNPNNQAAVDEVRRVIKGVIIEPVVTSEDDFNRFITSIYADLLRKEEESQARDQGSATSKNVPAVKVGEDESPAPEPESTESILESLQSEALTSLEVEEGTLSSDNVSDLSRSAEDAPIVCMANSILALAVNKGASDIHVEPQEKDLAVRFRVDGELQLVQVLPKKIQMGLISRFKIISKLDIAEKRLPQDGRISVRLEDRPIDFRVSTIPAKWGEKICMRILDKSNTLLGLDKLILHPEVLEVVRDMIS